MEANGEDECWNMIVVELQMEIQDLMIYGTTICKL